MLSSLLEQYRKTHSGLDPLEIVVAPAALASLAIKQSAQTKVGQVQVVCRLFDPSEVTKPGIGKRLGVFVYKNGGDLELRGCELA